MRDDQQWGEVTKPRRRKRLRLWLRAVAVAIFVFLCVSWAVGSGLLAAEQGFLALFGVILFAVVAMMVARLLARLPLRPPRI